MVDSTKQSMCVLVVDDEPDFRLLVRDYLLKNGMEVFAASNGVEALEKLSLTKMDFIISDVYMPVMDGVRLYRIIREMPMYQRTPFLFVSGYGDQYTLSAVSDPRYDGFLRKGSDPRVLGEWIEYLTTPDEQRNRPIPGQPTRFC